MGLFFKSDEEKKKEEKAKLEAVQKQTNKLLQGLGLDFDNYSEDNLEEKNKNDITAIAKTTGIGAAGELLSSFNMSNYEKIATTHLGTLIKQNWIIIRQLELITRFLNKTEK
ncbi:MAG: hypothetical protein PVJ09_02175 [Candidatus Woesebacteria bacterium]|jgi:hypothetical protein